MKYETLTVNEVETRVCNVLLRIVEPDEVYLLSASVEESGGLRPLTDSELDSVPYQEIWDLATEKALWD